MHVCFSYCMYILYKHTGPDTCHINHTWKSKIKQKVVCPGEPKQTHKQKIKTGSSKTAC